MKPHVGLIDCTWEGKPSRAEKRLGEWAAKRGLLVALKEDGEGNRCLELGIEELINGKMHAYWITMQSPCPRWPELWKHYERILRTQFEGYKEQQSRFPWWEHVP